MDFPGADTNSGNSFFLNQLLWSPPVPPYGIILHYNVRITSTITGETIVPLVEGITDTFFDVRPYALSTGDYFVEVNAILPFY